jgi:ribulose-bisphosphate carboxylase large chain
MSEDRFEATYRVQTPLPLQQAAEVLAGEQSSGTFVAVANETPELTQRFRARVESIREIDTSNDPALPGSRGKGP